MRKSQNVIQFNEFYGTPAAMIAAWCAVDIKTAQRWKRGTQRPTKSHLKLFQLYRERRVLDPELWPGWVVKGNVLVDPENHETTQSQLRAYALVYMLCQELLRSSGDEQAKQRFGNLIRYANAG